jgi:carbon storage regulator
MLVIRRRAGESILIAEDIEIEVLEITPTRVKLGIRAPKSVAVLRKEVRLTEEQNRAAASEISLDLLTPFLTQLRAKP